MVRTFLSRATLCACLAVAGLGAASPAMAQRGKQSAAKPSFSPAFQKVAVDLEKTLTEAKTNAAVMTASQQARAAGANAQAKAAAVAQVDAALGGGKAKLDAVAAAASTPFDRLKLGEMTRTYGVLVDDPTIQLTGLTTMLDSGVLPATAIGQVQWLAGVAAYQKRDFAAAAKYIQQAKDGGFQDPQLDAVLADSFKRSNNPAAALAMAQREIAAAKAAGTKPSEGSIRTALQSAYDAKQLGPSAEYATLLVQNYPSAQAWNVSINVVRALAGYQAQDVLDLMRLMNRAGAMRERSDYIEYIQSADARRNPGEVLKIIEAGTAAGKLNATEAAIAEAKGLASGRVAQDRADFPRLERDARAAGATASTVAGAADVFLNYGDAAKAADLYAIALTKPGGDATRLNTRLGIALVDKGDFAGAQAAFAKVEGPRQPLAQLWGVYAAQKAAGR